MGDSRVVRHMGAGWHGVPVRRYRDDDRDDDRDDGLDVARHVLLGPGEEGLSFETRYFSVAPGASSALEKHEHPHVVIVLEGSGHVVLGGRVEALAPFDVVFVAPWEVHQFRASEKESLGFLCIVDGERDRPQRLEGRP